MSRCVLAIVARNDGTSWVGTSEFGLAWYDGARFHRVPLGIAADAFASSPVTGTRFRSVPSR